VAGPEQHARRLDERRLEPGVLRGLRSARPVLPRTAVLWRALHDARDEPSDAGGAVPVRGLGRERERLRALGADQLVWYHGAGGATPGTSLPIDQFYVARPSDSAATINAALRSGRSLILTPGIYHVDQSITLTRPDTVVLGLGFPTLVPTNGNAAMTTARAKGILISGVIFDAGPTNSPVLLQVGSGRARSDNEASDPSTLSDVFFRIGGAEPGSATTSLIVNSNNVILDDIWAWRADHGNGVGWTSNTADTGVVVNGDNIRLVRRALPEVRDDLERERRD
jgi:hypothetical protein